MTILRKALVESADRQGFIHCFHGLDERENRAMPADVVIKESWEGMDLESAGFGNQLEPKERKPAEGQMPVSVTF